MIVNRIPGDYAPLEKAIEEAFGQFEADMPLIPKHLLGDRTVHFNRRHGGYHVDVLALGRGDWPRQIS
jgi:hypothetical protein